MGKDNVIRLVFDDDDKAPPRTEKQLKIDALLDDVRGKAKEIARGANTLTEYVHAFLLDYKYGVYEGISWMFDDGEGTTLDEIANDFKEGSGRREVEKTSEAILDMRSTLDSAPDKEGFVKLTVKKIRNGSFVEGVRVLADFPEGISIPHSGFDENASSHNSGHQVIYYEPNAACFRHAFDDANKASLQNSGSEYKIYYLPVLDTDKVQHEMISGPDGVAEYVLGKSEDGSVVKQNLDNYMWMGLVRRAWKEDKHFRVSDFFKRTTN